MGQRLEVQVDRREDLGSLLSSMGLVVEKRELSSADYRWEGQGPRGSCLVGLERKKLKDFANSTNYGRLIAQATRMGRELSYCYLVLEATIRPEPGTGYLQELSYRGGKPVWKVVFNKGISIRFRTLLGKLMTLSHHGPFRYFHSPRAEETARIIEALVYWWSKPWDKHSTTHKIWAPPPPGGMLEEPKLVSKMGVTLPGVGWDIALALPHYYHSSVSMVCANEAAWARVPGIGKTLSRRIVAALRNVPERGEGV